MATSADLPQEQATRSNKTISMLEVKVALVGQTGSGKSSYINAIMGLEEDDEHAVKTGDGNTTTAPQSFVHPQIPYITLWDQPGHSTEFHADIKVYGKFLKLNNYDAFFVFTKGCLTKNDLDLIRKIMASEKPFFLIRTNIDYDFYQKSRKKGFQQSVMLETIKDSIIAQCKNVGDGFRKDQIFLISNLEPQKWDFSLLDAKIVGNAPLWLETKKNKKDWIKKYFNEFVKSVDSDGLLDVALKLNDERLGNWKTIEIKLAVIGTSGAGKSSFINAIRNVEPSDSSRAKVGIVETTKEAKEYLYPDNKNIALWDLPGVASGAVPSVEKYFKQYNLSQYDAFLIILSKRVTNNDILLGQKLVSIRRPFMYIRAKIDEDFANANKLKATSKDEIRQEIRDDWLENLTSVSDESTLKDQKIFLVNNHDITDWDFSPLVVAIAEKLSINKRECFLLTQPALTEAIVEEKIQELKKRTWKAALSSTMTKLVTTKTYSSKVNAKRIVERAKFYRSQLGFPEDCPPNPGNVLNKFYVTNDMDVNLWLKRFDKVGDYHEDETTFMSLVTSLDKPFQFVQRSLHVLLEEMQEMALKFFVEGEEATIVELEDVNLMPRV